MAEEQPPKSSLPWLILPSNNNIQFSYENVFGNHDTINIEEDLRNMHLLGSCNGWLLMLETYNPAVIAVHPINILNRVYFPSLLTLPGMLQFHGDEYVYWSTSIREEVNVELSAIKNTFIKKIFLSKDPYTEEDCMAVVIFGEAKRLAYCKVTDKEWTVVPERKDEVQGYEDVIFDKRDRIYAINYQGTIRTAMVSSTTICWDHSYQPMVPDYSDGKYLVIDTIGQLLVVNRYTGWKEYDNQVEDISSWAPYKTKNFKVMRVDEVAGEVDEIFRLEDGGALFLGDNQSLFLSSQEIIEGGFKKHSIYFTDDTLLAYQEPKIGAHDYGIYDMKEGCVVTCDQSPYDDFEGGIWPPPIWVTLTFGCGN